MEYQVTATRRRPQNLQQLSGQGFVQQTLHNAISSGRIAHAYLFSGPRGVGKTSTARILARSLNCEQGPSSTPCNQCSNCQDILVGKAIDVIEIDGASHTGVDDIREIKDEVLYAPSSSRYKIFIIDEVHMLSNSAFNALLKTIEEPPEYIVFIFATTEIHKVPLTVRSRCQHYHFHLVQLELIQQNLAAACDEIGLEYRTEALVWVAREAKGSMRDAYTLFDQVVSFCGGNALSLELIEEKMGLIAIDQIGYLCDALIEAQMETAISLYQNIIQSGTSLEQLLIDLCEYLRALLLLQSGLSEQQLLLLLPYPSSHYSAKAQQAWNSEQLCHILERCFHLYRNLRYSINEHFEFELLLFELVHLRYYSSNAYQLKRLEELTGQLQKGLPDYDVVADKKNSKCLELESKLPKVNIAQPVNSHHQNNAQSNLQENLQAVLSEGVTSAASSVSTTHVDELQDIAGKESLKNALELETKSNISIELRAMVLKRLQHSNPTLAQSLAQACWTWLAKDHCLNILLPDVAVQQKLKQNNSLFLRVFQQALANSKISSITKLSFLHQDDSQANYPVVPTVARVDEVSVLQSRAIELAPPQVNKILAQAPAEPQMIEPTASYILPDMSQVISHKVPQSSAKFSDVVTDEGKTVEKETKDSLLEQASKRIVGEQIINDYSQLPKELQILQKVLLAQVKKIQIEPKYENKNQSD